MAELLNLLILYYTNTNTILNPKSSELGHLFCMILVQYLGHGAFLSGIIAVFSLFLSKSVFGVKKKDMP